MEAVVSLSQCSQGLGTSEKLKWLAANGLLPLEAHQASFWKAQLQAKSCNKKQEYVSKVHVFCSMYIYIYICIQVLDVLFFRERI